MEKQRIVYIDNIKVFLTCLVVAHHAAQAYGNTGGVWLVNDPAKADYLRTFFFLNASYMMGLYFFISGYFMFYSFNKKPLSTFISDRLKRLGIPLVLISLCVFLPLNYFGSSSEGNIISFFIETYLHNPPMGVGHLWFVACLLLYTLIYLSLEKLLPVLRSENTIDFKSYFPILYIFGLATIEYFVRLKYPIDKWETWIVPMEIAHLPQYFSLFILGTIFNSKKWLDKITLSIGVFYFLLALIAFVIYQSGLFPVEALFIETLIESILCVGIGLGMLVLFKQFANKMSGFIKHLSDNSYGIYIFHLFIVIILQNLILEWSLSATLKFLFVTLLGILLSVLLSSIFRRSKAMRSVL